MNAAASTDVAHTLLPDDGGVEVRGWTVTATQGPIASTAREEKLADELRIKMPGMFFADSNLCIANTAGFSLSFSAEDALRLVGPVDPTIRVSAAKVWDKRLVPDDVQIGVLEDASDWTFTTAYWGTLRLRDPSAQADDAAASRDVSDRFTAAAAMDYDLLRRQDIPILYFNQIILFEDELDDNGISSYRIRVRVHPGFFFVLARFFLRVDGVVVRVRDTRYFHKFGTNTLVRERASRECRYENLPRSVTQEALREPDVVANSLPIISSDVAGFELPAL